MTVWPQIPSKKLQYFVHIVCNNLGDDNIHIVFTVCAHSCMTNPTCSAFHYKKDTNDCLLVPMVLIKTNGPESCTYLPILAVPLDLPSLVCR